MLQLAPKTACGFKRETTVETARQEAELEYERVLAKFGMSVISNDYNYKLSNKAGMAVAHYLCILSPVTNFKNVTHMSTRVCALTCVCVFIL